jgi:hypothetical protein
LRERVVERIVRTRNPGVRQSHMETARDIPRPGGCHKWAKDCGAQLRMS